MSQRSPDEIRNDIEQTREELGETVEALAAKTDVKAQAHARIDDVKQQAKQKVDEVKQRVETVVGGQGEGAGAPVAGSVDAKQKAREGAQRVQKAASDNPVRAAAIGGFVGGLIVGRLTSRG